MPNPPSLGDESKEQFRLINETFPVPEGGRKGLLRAIEQILNGGGVQKIIISVSQPLRVIRAVKDNGELDVPPELIDDDIMSAVRNAEMEEVSFADGAEPYECLFRAFRQLLQKEVEGARLQPKVFIVKRKAQLQQWLGTKDVGDLFGVDVIEHKEVPDEVLLFVGALASDVEDVKYTLKLVLDLPWKAK